MKFKPETMAKVASIEWLLNHGVEGIGDMVADLIMDLSKEEMVLLKHCGAPDEVLSVKGTEMEYCISCQIGLHEKCESECSCACQSSGVTA
jgi:hypothetical protein